MSEDLLVVWKNEHLHRVAARPRPLGLQAAGGEGLQHAADHLQGKKLLELQAVDLLPLCLVSVLNLS